MRLADTGRASDVGVAICRTVRGAPATGKTGGPNSKCPWALERRKSPMWMWVYRIVLGGLIVYMTIGGAPPQTNQELFPGSQVIDTWEFVSDGYCSGDYTNDLDCTQ
jgi:hypothetical protein